LIHCAENIIPVTVFSRRGFVKAQIYQPLGRTSSLHDWLDAVLYEEDLRAAYSQWLQHQQMRLCAELGVKDGDWSLRVVRLREQCARHAGSVGCKGRFREAKVWLQGLLKAHVDTLFAQRGIPPVGAGRELLNADVVDLLSLRTEVAALQWAVANDDVVTAVNMASLYQGLEEWISLHAERLLVQLQVAIDRVVMCYE
jgi:hypothetical protein